eukprot:CAMPEP_0175062246 /NCGR_PEP_ID=MMETSP0052_2-20121109/14054_1 /TAXON_ID=51329 ORGANISM="Polytomella parva, Strain SAG 63-3" /NCGR_SAMPLE_ID=MMETSP0052_2 /ASSEMBLY_ACC=CAM_ASM_000194 /LENGTH=51 /DNA_ID=CAMNT_0016328231 /DNA_START=184 /DNA_END=336 /DNA_ORIENTATION=+
MDAIATPSGSGVPGDLVPGSNRHRKIRVYGFPAPVPVPVPAPAPVPPVPPP